jgi:hypothetical protein
MFHNVYESESLQELKKLICLYRKGLSYYFY